MIQLPVMMRRRPKIQSLLYSALGPGLALMALLAIAAVVITIGLSWPLLMDSTWT